MPVGKRKKKKQKTIWVETESIVNPPGHPFYERLNNILEENGFDAYAEDLCAKFYAEGVGRHSIPPGVYFRMLMIGYFEGIDSERGIAWRCQDSLALRSFLGYELTEATPEHSSLSRIRNRIDVETHQEVFSFVLGILAKSDLLKGQTLAVDATTLEANAAMRSIVRKDTGESYREFLERLASESGVSTPTREELTRFDRKRKKKTSNDDWTHPHEPDSRVTKMKDGRTHMGHKSEHAVDLDTEAIVSVAVRGADEGDTATLFDTLCEAEENLGSVSGGTQNRPLRGT